MEDTTTVRDTATDNFPSIKTRRLERESEHQRYYLSSGVQVSGASSIAKMGDSPEGIIYWAWGMGMKGQDYRKYRESTADTGHIAHFLVDCHLEGALPDLREFTEEEIALAQPSFNKFLAFLGREKLTMLSKEEQLVHEELKFGGTLDLRAVDEYGRNTLIDWKSSKKLYNSHKWQLGGYELLSNANHEDKIERRAIVRIGRDADDSFHVHWIPQEKAERNMGIFEAQVKLYNLINESKYGKK
jgi:hypothetical protein